MSEDETESIWNVCDLSIFPPLLEVRRIAVEGSLVAGPDFVFFYILRLVLNPKGFVCCFRVELVYL